MSDVFWLNKEQSTRPAPNLPANTHGKPLADDLRVVGSILHVQKSGRRWFDSWAADGPRTTLYNRFVR